MRKEEPRAQIRSWASERLSDQVRRSIDRLARSDDVRRIAIMPDVHLGRDACVGTAFATGDLLYLDALGGDIGCGMAAIAFDAHDADVTGQSAKRLHRAIREAVPIQRHPTSKADHLVGHLPAPDKLSTAHLRSLANSEGRYQIGTLGTGNHFLEVQHDEDGGRLWLMVHSGSRGMGQAIRTAHREKARRSRTGLMYLDATTPAGEAYLHDMQWARAFAAASRRAMLSAVGDAAQALFGWSLLKGTCFDCDHNHITHEEHGRTTWFVHRKGAIPAWRDQPGIVPGSMAAPSYHVIGRGVPESLCSSAHGAGRAMSRSEARSRISRSRLVDELRDVFHDLRMVGGLCEEAPSAYKDIRAVMRAQRKLVRVRRTLLPILTYKAVGD